jgi:tetratricopeptide (TPR) repeat protein
MTYKRLLRKSKVNPRTITINGIVMFAALAVLTRGAHAAQPWDTGFNKDTRAVMEAASRVVSPKDQSVVVLLEDHRYTIDREGRTASTIRKVYRILKEDAIEDWASVEHDYQPWYEQLPQIRARVIGSDGAIHWLDAKTIADSPAREFDASIFSDSRVLRAPLPAIHVGSIVEYEIAIREKLPLLDAGVTRRITVIDSVPHERLHVLIEADSAIELRTVGRLIPETAIRRKQTSTGTQIDLELGPLEARKSFEYDLPPEIPHYPYFSFSTGKSWQAIAARYESIVDQQIKSGNLRPILDGIDLKGTPAVVAAQLVAKLHKDIRYTGVEFGEAAIVPRSPAETLQRKYGDCKDKAALLVAMLRAAGLDAYVALLASGSGADVDEQLPGFGLFDHAIVYVASEPALWIDATAAETRVGLLPTGAQGRLALIARRDTKALVTTPVSEAKDNWERHTIEVRLSDYGPGEFTETIEMGGSFEANMRVMYGGDETKTKEHLESYVKQNFMAKSLGRYEVTGKEDMSGPFRMKVQALQAARATTGVEDAAVALFPFRVFDELPFALRARLDDDIEDASEAKKPRKHDFVFLDPYQAEYRYKISVPALFKPNQLPASAEIKLGPATYFRKFQVNDDGTVEAIFNLTTGKRRLSPAEFMEFRESVGQHAKQVPELITFVPETSEHIAMGQTGKALALLRDHVGRNMEQSTSHVRLSRLLVTAGLGDAALAEGKKAVELDSNSSQAWQALGWAYQHDTLGRRLQGNWDAAEAESCYRRAVAADPEDAIAKADLAILLEHNRQGHRYGKGARLDEAITLYREVLKKYPSPELQQNLALALLYAGHVDNAKEEAQKAGSERRTILQSVIIALKQGPAKAIVDAQTAEPEPRARALHLLNVSVTLMQLRRYDIANAVMTAAARLANSVQFQNRVEVLRKLKRYEDVLLPASDPRSPVQRLFLQILLGEGKMESFQPLFTSREKWTTWKNASGKLRGQISGIRHDLGVFGLTDDTVVDLFLSALDLQKEGEDDRGYRITGTATPGSGGIPVMYVVRENGEYRILGSSGSLEHVGEIVLELLDKKDIKGAQWWLDKVLPDLEHVEGNAGVPASKALWSGVTPETRGPGAIKLAAASLIGRYSVSEKAIEILQNARTNSSDSWEQTQIDVALCESLVKARKWDELLVVSKRLMLSKMRQEEGFEYFTRAAGGAKKWKELEQGVLRRLQSVPTDRTAMRALARVKARLGDHASAAEWIKKSAVANLIGLEERIFEVWNAIVAGKADQEMLANLKKEGDDTKSARYHYTLAMLHAVLHMPEEAQQSLRLAVVYEDFSGLDAKAWAVYGKICEQYGFSKEALAAFARVQVDGEDDEIAEWARAVISGKPFSSGSSERP